MKNISYVMLFQFHGSAELHELCDTVYENLEDLHDQLSERLSFSKISEKNIENQQDKLDWLIKSNQFYQNFQTLNDHAVLSVIEKYQNKNEKYQNKNRTLGV